MATSGLSCPIASAHKRMEDAHHLWHEALEAYNNPEDFRVKLNGCITTLRTVTWLIQKTKPNIPEFDSWYKPWQEKMRKDPIMRWLVNARNKIEKEGDLDTKSSALVSVCSSRFSSSVLELTMDPFKPTSEIAREIAGSPDVEIGLKRNGALRVERRWLANNLPEVELLDALSHVYGFLNSLISSAHSQIGLQETCVMRLSEKGQPEKVLETKHLKGRLPCMVGVAEDRAIWVNLSNGNFRDVLRLPLEIKKEKKDLNYAAKRYSPKDFSFGAEGLKPSWQEMARNFMEMAKRVLQKDHFHDTFIFLKLPNGEVEINEVEIAEPGDWSVFWNKLAAKMEQNGASGLIVISEIWIAPFDPHNPYANAAYSSERNEALRVVAAEANGKEISWITVFKREGTEIKFDETKETIGILKENSFLEPIRKVWTKRQSLDNSPPD
jgi:hypothetical protein